MENTGNIMDKICDYLYDSTLQMIVQVEAEEYEKAQVTKNDIETKIISIKNMLISKGLTKLTDIQLEDELISLKRRFLKDWYEVLDIPIERRSSI